MADKGVTETEKETYDAAGSYQREIQQDIQGKLMGTKTPPKPLREDSQAEKETEPADTNPKRGENSRPK